MSEKGTFDHSQGSEEVHKDWFHWPLASVRPPGITLPWTEALRGNRAWEWERASRSRALWLRALGALRSRVVEAQLARGATEAFASWDTAWFISQIPAIQSTFIIAHKTDTADVPGLRCWRCRMAKEQTNWGRGRTAQISIPGGLEESFSFLPPCENINSCFINSCHFLTYKESQSFPFVYFDDLWNKLQTTELKKKKKHKNPLFFHFHFSEGGISVSTVC